MHESFLRKLNECVENNHIELRKKAEKAREIILSDFSVFDSVETVAQKVGLTEPRLQVIFKQLYGTTVGKFSRQERLKQAHEILVSGNDILLTVALMTGYNDVSNFSTAFKQHFGYSPGYINKLKRQREAAIPI